MGLIRILLILLLLWVIWSLARKTLAALRPPPPPPAGQAQPMVRCLHCGVHVPEQEAIWREERTFCSHEHHQAWLKKHD